MIVSTSFKFKWLLPQIEIPRHRRRCGYCSSPSHRTPLTREVVVLWCKTRYRTLSSKSNPSRGKWNAVVQEPPDLNSGDDDVLQFQVVAAVTSTYNDIIILDTPKSRMLLLDSTQNVHSIFNKGQKWTGSYWDEFASLPAIVPKGPIAIFGLGGGTAANLMLGLWPSLQLEGWEIDQILIDKAREYFQLSDLEEHTQDGGILHVHVGDALSSSTTVPGGYAGIVIDLFSDGKVLTQLQEVETWLELKDKLMPNGRLMVNCGGTNAGTSHSNDRVTHPEISSTDGTWEQNYTLKALCKAFPGQVSWKKMSKEEGENYLALTGPLPDLTTWSAAVPDRLNSSVKQWRSL